MEEAPSGPVTRRSVSGEVSMPLFTTGTLKVSTSPGTALNPIAGFKLTVLSPLVLSTVTPAAFAIRSTGWTF